MLNLNTNWISSTIQFLSQWHSVVKANFEQIQSVINGHLSGTADKHSADKIDYTGAATGTNVKAAIDNVKTEVDNLNFTGSEHDALVTSSLIDTENENFGQTGTGTFLNGRLGKWEQRILGIFKNLRINSSANVGDQSTLELEGNYLSIGRVLSMYNHTGITDGSLNDLLKARESLVGHHYNDNNVIQIDNVGRGNVGLVLKQARNFAHAKHKETGRGKYIQLLRDCYGELPIGDYSSTGTQTILIADRVLRTSNNHVYKSLGNRGSINLGTEDYTNTTNWQDLGAKVDYTTDDGVQNITTGMRVYNKFDGGLYQAVTNLPNLQLNIGDYNNEAKWSFAGGFGNEELGVIDCLDWNDLLISATPDDFGIALTGRMGDSNKARTIKPVLVYTKGISSTKLGSAALKLYSLDYGGSCVELNNVSTSKNYMVKLVNVSQQSNSGGFLVDNSGLSPAIAIISRGVNQPCVNAMRTDAVTYGDFLKYISETGNPLFQVAGDGKSVKMIDSATGALKTVTIVNGVLTVS